MLGKFKEGKKIMMIKMEQADKIAEDAADEFLEVIESLAKDASEEDLKMFIESEDDAVEAPDKLAFLAAYADSHDSIGGIAIIGLKK